MTASAFLKKPRGPCASQNMTWEKQNEVLAEDKWPFCYHFAMCPFFREELLDSPRRNRLWPLVKMYQGWMGTGTS